MNETRFDGTAYIDGSKTGTAVRVEVLSGSLRVRWADGTIDLPMQGARFHKGGYNDQQLVVTAQTDQGKPVVLYVTRLHKVVRALLSSGADRKTEAVLDRLKGGSRGLKIVGLLAGAGVLVYLLYLLVSVLGVHAVDFAVDHVPVEVEEELGEQAAGQVLSEGRVCAAPAMNQALVTIMERLEAANDEGGYTFRFYLADSTEVNAFALPGGYIFVNRGLIEKAGSPEEVAGVLAHEMTHVTARHGLRNVVARAGMWLIAGLLFGDTTGAGGLIAGGASELLNLSFSRTQEEAADQGGLALLVAARIDPRGLPDFFEKLLEEEGNLSAAIPSFMSSHPETRERIRMIRVEIDGLGAQQWTPIDVDWEASRAACDPIPSSDAKKTAREFATQESAVGGASTPRNPVVDGPPAVN
ncbi:MAG: M48 family metallopeptidase [Pseudomonadota bacterium]